LSIRSSNKLFEQMPMVNREGMDVQVKDAVSRKPGSTFKVDDVVDDTSVGAGKGRLHQPYLQITSLACPCQLIAVGGKYPLST
jgi:hypothetical protein